MKILKIYTYDYYEWEEVAAVSLSIEMLEEHLKKIKTEDLHLYSDAPLSSSDEERVSLAKSETPHWAIECVTYLA